MEFKKYFSVVEEMKFVRDIMMPWNKIGWIRYNDIR